ncbi:MAG: BCCT family transporter, partial [Burkholderiales bacterium]
HPHPSQALKVFWGGMMSLIAAVLLAAGGLTSLQTASLVAALPFAALLILLMVALVRLLRSELPAGHDGLQRHGT